MRQTVVALADELGLTVRDLQAVMWYYEQRVYTALGVNAFSGSYKDASRRFLEGAGFKSPGGLEAYRKTEEGGKDARFSDIAGEVQKGLPKTRRLNLGQSFQIEPARPLSEVTGRTPEDLYQPDADPEYLEPADEIFNQIRIEQLEEVLGSGRPT